MAKRLTWFIVVGMIAGIIAGYFANIWIAGDDALTAEVTKYLKLPAEIFLHLIKMIVAPLVLSTIIVGIAHMNDGAALGRVGGRALLWFITASLVSISLGLLLANFFQPGAGLTLTATTPLPELATGALNVHDFVLHIFPSNIIESMGKNDILQILVFAIFAGLALASLGEKGEPVVRVAEAVADMMLRMTNYVMLLAPLAVFGALAAAIAQHGIGILVSFATLVGEFYFGLLILWVILLSAGFAVMGKRIWSLIRYIREPVLIAFSTSTSEAALPRLFEQLDRFGVPRRISGFMLPMGYSFNLDGSMMYMSFATLFIAQAYGINLPIGTQIAMLLTMMVTSKGIAAVPRASLVVIAATLTQFGLPVEGIALILGIDVFLDMGRTATNVLGNAVATGAITKWEGMLQPEMPDADTDPLPPFDTPEDGRKGLHLEGGATS